MVFSLKKEKKWPEGKQSELTTWNFLIMLMSQSDMKFEENVSEYTY